MSGNAFPRAVLDEILPIPVDDYRICADSYLNAMSPLLGPRPCAAALHGCRRMHGTNWSMKPLDLRLTDRAAVWRSDCRWVRQRLVNEGVVGIGDWDANPFVRSMQRMRNALTVVDRCTRRGRPVCHGRCRSGRHALHRRRSSDAPAGSLRFEAVPCTRRDRRSSHRGRHVPRRHMGSVRVADTGRSAQCARQRHRLIADTEDVVVFRLGP